MIEPLPNLTHEEELKYLNAARNGDDKAKEILIRANIRQVMSIIKPIDKSKVSFEDLLQQGCIGLCLAIEKFDVTKEAKFSTYAAYHIKKAIFGYLPAENSFKVGNSKFYDALRIRRIKDNLESEFDREPSLDEIAKVAGCSKKMVQQYLRVATTPLSLEKIEEDYNFLGEDFFGINHETEPDAFDSTLDTLRKEKLSKAFAEELTPRERKVLSLRFGLNGSPMTLDRVSQACGVTRERVRQIQQKAMKKLAKCKSLTGLV